MPSPTVKDEDVDTNKYIIEEKEPKRGFISPFALSMCLYHHHLAAATNLPTFRFYPILFPLAFYF